ncbi:MAG: hypothetical protein R3349_04170 [Geminicoccaceae bacterium]|nr:hypothetical protein [Geminicoccaceae bacterium]
MIYVCNLHDMPSHVGTVQPSHLVSLVTSAEQPPTPETILVERHLRIEIDDISEPMPGGVLPERHHVERLVEFLRVWEHDDAPLLIHCVAGVSRSMASALIGLVLKANGREDEAARHLRREAPHAQPNRRIIALADEILGLGGRLIAAREAMGPAEVLIHGPLVRLPLLDDRPA